MSQTEFPQLWSPARDVQDGERREASPTNRKNREPSLRDIVPTDLAHIRIDLNASVTRDSVRDGAQAFLRWWGGQLLTFVPQAIRARIAALFPRYELAREGGAWILRAPGKIVAIALDPAMPLVELRERIIRFEPHALSSRVDVWIAPTDILTRKIRLAAAARAQLRAAVRLQLERLSPFKAEDVAFDCRAEPEESDGEIAVTVALVPRATLDELERSISALGLTLRGFRTADGWTFAPRHRPLTKPETLQLGLLGVAFATILAAVLLAPVLRDAELGSLDLQLSEMRGPARTAAALRDQWEGLRNPMAAASERLSAPSPLDILKLLTNRLPDDVQLSMITIDGRSVVIEGTAPSAKRVVQALARVQAFTAIRLGVQRPAPAGEKFDIVMSLAGPDAP